MATKSILKNVNIKEKHLARSFVCALENASGRKGKEVVLSKSFAEIKKHSIKLFFGDAK